MPGKLTPAQGRVLDAIRDAGPDGLTRDQVAEFAGVSATSVKVMVSHIRAAAYSIKSSRKLNPRGPRGHEVYWIGTFD